jgi:hypothetical protein
MAQKIRSDITKHILLVNKISPEKEKEFFKQLRLYLRIDYGISAKEVRKMNDNKVAEEWFRLHSLPENRIGGAEEVLNKLLKTSIDLDNEFAAIVNNNFWNLI